MSQKLYVGGIAFSTTSEGLRQHFTQSGTVVSASIVTDQFSGQSRGFGFVEMSTPDEAQQAVSQLNERQLDGRSLKVEVAKPKTTSPHQQRVRRPRRRQQRRRLALVAHTSGPAPRLTALTTARSEAVTMLAWMPTPQRTLPSPTFAST